MSEGESPSELEGDAGGLDSLPYGLGFRSVEVEQASVDANVEGQIPEWLQGSLLRNGPGSWTVGPGAAPPGIFRHWFDGFALLHAFAIGAGKVRYCNRFLRTPDREEALRSGKISRPGFATDPCRSLFRKVMSMFVSEVGANANVSIARLGPRFLALTETPMAVEFEPETLRTLGLFDFEKDALSGQITSAHPLPWGESLFNFTVKMGRPSRYHGYRAYQDGPALRRQEFASHATSEPAYLHSCGLTSEEMVLFEGPLLVNPLDLLWRSRPYIECYRWKPEGGAKIVRLPRGGGASQVAQGPALFVFHHVNSFYEGGELCVDVLAYSDADVIGSFYFSALETAQPIPMPTLTRLTVRGPSFSAQPLASVGLELPRIHPGCLGRPYRFVYGITRCASPFYNGLAKVDVHSGEAKIWTEVGCYAGEPVFVPQGVEEDQGVVLSVVLHGQQGRSFLLFLDGRTFQEVARAYVPAVVPFGFHGLFEEFKNGRS